MLRLRLGLMLAVPAMLAQAPDPALTNALKAHQAGEVESAITGYREYLKRHPNDVEIRSNLGAALAREGRYSEASLYSWIADGNSKDAGRGLPGRAPGFQPRAKTP